MENNKVKYNRYNTDSEGLRLPESRGLECQVLADLVANPELLPQVRGIVSGQMFTSPGLQKAWTILNEMSNSGATIDVSTIGTRVEKETFMAIIGVEPGLTLATIDHCRALAEMATRRLMWSRAYDMMIKAGDTGTEMARLLSMPGKLVDDLNSQTVAGRETQSITEVLNSYSNELQDRANGTVRKVPTGFPRLDKTILGGWTGGNLVVMSARPSVGKSAVMLNMAVSASRAGFPATVYSLEMPNIDLGQRLVLSTGFVRPGDIVNDTAVQSLDWGQIERANGQFDNLPLWFNTKLRTLDEICNDIVLQHDRGRCEVAFIDHLHIISNTDNRVSAYQAITERTRRFKLLAMDTGIPVVLLCQLNRMADTENRPPDLRDLRDSGSIEQDADIVLMLDRPGGKTDPRVNMWVRKNRNGKAGDILIGLNGDVSRGFTVFSERDTENDYKTPLRAEYGQKGGAYQ